MTAAFDDMNLRDLVEYLTDDEQHDVRSVVLRLVASHGELVEPRSPRKHRLSITGIAKAGPDFASTSQEVLRRELGGQQ